MTTPARNYPEWKAPSEDGHPLVWPDTRTLVEQTGENHRRLSRAVGVKLQGVPLPQVRRRMRSFVGHDNDQQPLIATGHQSELHHPGVWVKNVMIDALARLVDGQAFHVAVDTDQPKHLSVRWPDATGAAVVKPITDDPAIASASWASALAPGTPAHLDEIRAALKSDSASWKFAPLLDGVLGSLKRISLDSMNLSAAITNATHELDWSLGLRHHALLASPLFATEPYLIFVHHLLAHADEFAAHYNAALAEYRSAHGINSRMRPMPDLFVTPESIEVPFWLDDLHTGKRSRPSVFRSERGWMIELVGGETFEFDPSAPDGWEAAARLQRWLVSTRHRIAPRALTLTMFLRLAAVDQFVHGIGGGRYDQVTDRIVETYFGIEPPAFSVTTATLFFPDALERTRVCVPCVKHEGHRLRHGLLGERKRVIVAQIDALPRRSAQRAERFYLMHGELAAAVRTSEALSRWEDRLRETQLRERAEETLFDRELFYAIQSRSRLLGLVDQYNSLIR